MLEKWTEEWRGEIVDAYVAGELVTVIAERFGVSLTYPGAMAKRAGIRLRGAGATWRRRDDRTDPWNWSGK